MRYFEALARVEEWAPETPMAYAAFESIAYARAPDGTLGQILLSLWDANVYPDSDSLDLEVKGAHFHGKVRIEVSDSDLFTVKFLDSRNTENELVMELPDLHASELIEALDDGLENFGLGSVERFGLRANAEYQYKGSESDGSYELGSVDFNNVCEDRWNSLLVSERQKIIKSAYPQGSERESWNFERKMWTGFTPEQKNHFAISMYLHLPQISGDSLSLFMVDQQKRCFLGKDGNPTSDLGKAFRVSNTVRDRTRADQFSQTCFGNYLFVPDFKAQGLAHDWAKSLEKNSSENPETQESRAIEAAILNKVKSVGRFFKSLLPDAVQSKIDDVLLIETPGPLYPDESLRMAQIISDSFELLAREIEEGKVDLGAIGAKSQVNSKSEAGNEGQSGEPNIISLAMERAKRTIPVNEEDPENFKKSGNEAVTRAVIQTREKTEGLLNSSHRFLVLANEAERRRQLGLGTENLRERLSPEHKAAFMSEFMASTVEERSDDPRS